MLPRGTETQLSILYTVLRADKPLQLSDIADQAGMAKQKVHYHIPALVKQGLLVPHDLDGARYYSLQPPFLREELFRAYMDEMRDLFHRLGNELIGDHVADLPEAVKNNFALFIRILDLTL